VHRCGTVWTRPSLKNRGMCDTHTHTHTTHTTSTHTHTHTHTHTQGHRPGTLRPHHLQLPLHGCALRRAPRGECAEQPSTTVQLLCQRRSQPVTGRGGAHTAAPSLILPTILQIKSIALLPSTSHLPPPPNSHPRCVQPCVKCTLTTRSGRWRSRPKPRVTHLSHFLNALKTLVEDS
jgi:hypothetical protein